jgi:hypothetical protein
MGLIKKDWGLVLKHRSSYNQRLQRLVGKLNSLILKFVVSELGSVAEWLKAPVLKTGDGVSRS